MGRLGLRLVALGAVVTTLAATLVACAPGTVSGAGTVQVRTGQDATLTAGPTLEVSVPGSSIKGDGELTAVPVEGPDGVTGWSIEMSGAELVGPAEVRFATALDEGEPLPVYTSTSDGVTYEVADNVAQDGDDIVVTTTHFSNWFQLRWSELMEKARAGLDAIYRDAGKQPSCKGEDIIRAAGYSITSDGGSRVYWCLGENFEGEASLKAVNGRGYTVAAEHTPGLAVTAGGPSDVLGHIASFLKETPSKAGNTVTLVGPGSTIDYDATGTTAMGVRFQPSVPGYLVTAGQYAVDTLAMVLPYAGKGGMSKLDIAKLFEWESCVAGFSSLMSSEIKTATQGSNVFNDAVGTVLGCMNGALAKAGLTFFGTAVAAGLSWLTAGVRTALNGFGAAADTALNPSGYSIYVTPPKPERWLIDATGIGPVKLGADLTADGAYESVVGDQALCTAGTWGVGAFGNPRVDGVFVLGGAADDETAPATASGITVGSDESQLVALGATRRDWEMEPTYSIYTWREDGVLFSARVSPEGVTEGVGVGTDLWYLDYCH